MSRSTRSEKFENGGSDEATLVLDYLRKQNRPYSALDVSANLRNKVTKTHVTRILRELHQTKLIECRVAGKQAVYHALQEESVDDTSAANADVESRAKNLQGQLSGLHIRAKKARMELAALCANPLLSEIEHDIGQLEKEREAKLTQVQGSKRSNVSPVEALSIEEEWKRWHAFAGTRKRICHGLWQRCSEVLPEGVSREQLWESLGLEETFFN